MPNVVPAPSFVHNPYMLEVPAVQELAKLRQWVCWKMELSPKGKPTKVPYHPTRRKADGTPSKAQSTNPKTWSDHEDVLKAAYIDGLFDGIGFVFSADDPYVGVDLDKCRTLDGGLTSFALESNEALASYTEISPSGTGLHIICRGSLPAAMKTDRIEMYDRGRFFCFTGQQLEGGPDTIEPAGEALRALYEAHKSHKGNGHAEIVEIAELDGSLDQLASAFTVDMYEALIDDDQFRLRWRAKETGDPSRDIFRILCACARTGDWSDDALAGLYIKFYRRHNPDKLNRNNVLEFIAGQIAQARSYAHHDDAERGELEFRTQEIGPLATASELMKLQIDKVMQHGEIKSDWYFEAYGHTIRIGKTRDFLSPMHVANVMFEITGKVMHGMKRHEWGRIAELLKQAAVIEKNEETEDSGALWHALGEYLQRSVPKEATYSALDNRQPVLHKGKVYIHKMSFQAVIENYKVRTQMSVSEWLKCAGFQAKQLNRRDDRGQQCTIWYHGIDQGEIDTRLNWEADVYARE